MFSDGALLFWTFVTLAATFGVGAYGLEGAKARNLWLLAGLFLIAAFVLWLGFPALAARYAPSLLRVIWMLYPLLTVTVVALLVQGKKAPKSKGVDLTELMYPPPPAEQQLPGFAAKQHEHSKWSPDMPFKKAMSMFASRTNVTGTYRTPGDIKTQLIHALWVGKVTAWGKAHPDDKNPVQIAKDYWKHADVTLETNFAFSSAEGAGIYNVELSRAQMDVVWPGKSKS